MLDGRAVGTAGVVAETEDYLMGNIDLEILLERIVGMIVIHRILCRLLSYHTLSVATSERIGGSILSLVQGRDLFPLRISVRFGGQLAFQNISSSLPITLFHNSVLCDA
jgi:hypothetical protein